MHEQILPAVNRLDHRVHFTDICIDHSGYTDLATRAQKNRRNLRLLQIEETEQLDDPFTLFNAETLGIAVLEALAASGLVVPRARGALPETTAGCGRLIAASAERAAYLDQFVAATVAALEQSTAAEAPAREGQLRRQVHEVNMASTWPTLAGRWTEWLQGLG